MEKEIVDALGVISDHIVNSLVNAIGAAKDDILKKASGKKVHIDIDITIPDFTK